MFVLGLHEPANQDGQGLWRNLTLQARTGDSSPDALGSLDPEVVTTARDETRLKVCINALIDRSDNPLARR